MAESTHAAHRQMQLEKQRILLDQKRKSRQLQSGKVTINQLGGTRPSTAKQSRPSTSKQSRPSTAFTQSKPITINNVDATKSHTTETSSPTLSPTKTSSPLPTPTETSSPLPTPTKTSSPLPTPTETSSPLPTPTKTSSPLPIPTEISSPLPIPTETSSPLPTPTETSSPLPIPTETSNPLPTPTETSNPPAPPKIAVRDSINNNMTELVTTATDERVNISQEETDFVDVSRKLREMGISPTMSYDSEAEESQNADTDNNNIGQETIVPIMSTIINQPINEAITDNTILNPLNATVQDRMIKNLEEVVFRTPPEGVTIKCRITRDKQGVDRYMYPTYYMHMEWDEHTKMFLLAARKKKKSRSSYYAISVDPVEMTRDGDGFIAKLRSNFVGTSFVVYDNGCKALPSSPSHATVTDKRIREELAAIIYETNILGFKGPRRMNVVIPCMTKENTRIHVQPNNNSETLLERYKTKQLSNLLQIYNKQPVWSPETQAYVLNFRGRVTEASVKNFQLVHSADEEYVIMQFGKISEDLFTMDYSFPISAVQAFAIALSSFDSKLACE